MRFVVATGRRVVLFVALGVFGLGSMVSSAPAACLDPPGDLSGDGFTTVADVQCSVLVSLWTLAGALGPTPGCLKVLGSPILLADVNCDGLVNVSDSILLVGTALGFPFSPALDTENDGCVDACQSDLDGDGDLDIVDCAPLDPLVLSTASEACNGFDDNCDGAIDDSEEPSVLQSCEPETLCLVGAECTTPESLGTALIIAEVHPLAASGGPGGQFVELFNPTDSPINVNGWAFLVDGSPAHTIDAGSGLFVAAGAHLALARDRDTTANGGIWTPYGWGLAGDWLSSGTALSLVDAEGGVVDTVPLVAGGLPAAAGASAALVDPLADNSLAASWVTSSLAYGTGDSGTPGGPNRGAVIDRCTTGEPPDCDDDNPCTDDDCAAETGCTHTPNSEVCDDGDACTLNDVCSAGACTGGTPVDCDDDNSCTVDTCTAGICGYETVTGACDDGDACTTVDICMDDVCLGSVPLECTDDNPCTDDLCVPPGGCVYTPNTFPCTDDDTCTDMDMCGGGACLPGAPLNCEDGNVCTDNTCDPASGCVTANNTETCTDNNPCTTTDVCSGGACQGSGALTCDDANACTEDSCDPASGCVYTNTTASCSDGDPCTPTDACSGGTCVGSGTLPCNDSNPCTDDSCQEGVGCVFADNTGPCNDGNSCTPTDVCSGGSCIGSGSLTCSDSNPCTNDSCSPSSGCVFSPNSNSCDDGNACTTSSQCSGGSCVGTGSLSCSDGNPCTNDSCNPSSGCVFPNNSNSCNDGNACTPSSSCSGGSCVGSGSVSCNDNNPCTTDSCNPSSGCVFNNVFCSSTTQVYRMWWPNVDHMDSLSSTEGAPTYISEGAHYRVFNTQGPGFSTIYRKYAASQNNHMTTTAASEGGGTFVLEASFGYCPPVPTPQANKALYRYFSSSFLDHVTAWSNADKNNAISLGYTQDPFILCYVQ